MSEIAEAGRRVLAEFSDAKFSDDVLERAFAAMLEARLHHIETADGALDDGIAALTDFSLEMVGWAPFIMKIVRGSLGAPSEVVRETQSRPALKIELTPEMERAGREMLWQMDGVWPGDGPGEYIASAVFLAMLDASVLP